MSPQPAQEAARAAAKPSADATAAVAIAGGEFPKSPPVEVLEGLNRAAEVLEELASKRLTLRFAVDKERQRIEVEVRDAEGHVLRTIPSRNALELLSSGGGSSSLLFDSLV